MIRNFFKDDQLYVECLIALHVKPLNDGESNLMHEVFKSIFPITKWGKIDWDKLTKKISIGYNPKNINSALKHLLEDKSFSRDVYIEWSTGGLPIIKTNLDDIIKSFDDVTCVSFEKFIFNLDIGYVIEILTSDEMTIGLVEKERIALCAHLKKFLELLPIEKFHNKYNDDDMRWIRKLLNPFVQKKYWNIGEAYDVKFASEIIPSLEVLLKQSIEKDILLIWDDKQFPTIETDLEKVVPLWEKLSAIKIPFKIIAINSSYCINVTLENGIKITVNFGLKSQ